MRERDALLERIRTLEARVVALRGSRRLLMSMIVERDEETRREMARLRSRLRHARRHAVRPQSTWIHEMD